MITIIPFNLWHDTQKLIKLTKNYVTNVLESTLIFTHIYCVTFITKMKFHFEYNNYTYELMVWWTICALRIQNMVYILRIYLHFINRCSLAQFMLNIPLFFINFVRNTVKPNKMMMVMMKTFTFMLSSSVCHFIIWKNPFHSFVSKTFSLTKLNIQINFKLN